jgi:hypothetical protein
VATSISEDSAALHHPPVRDFKWVCAGSMSGPERERESVSRVCLERPLFHSPRQTDTYSLTLHNRGGKQNIYIFIYIYITLKKQKTKNL